MSCSAAVRLLSAFNLLLLLLFCPAALARYEANDTITLWMSKVAAYSNPQETYDYYDLFCFKSGNVTHKSTRFGDVLGGYVLVDSQLDINFKRNIDRISMCELHLDASAVKQFKNAIDKHYFSELFMDDLPLWGFIGENDWNEKYSVYTHKHFQITYNSDQIIHVNFTQERPREIEVGKVLSMTYSVKWIPTHINYGDRFEIYFDYPFFDRQTHWSSVSNPLLVVILVAALVSVVLIRTLFNDDTKDGDEDSDLETLVAKERGVTEDSRWKLVYADVFRPPRNVFILSAFVGTGAQLTVLCVLAMILTIMGMLYIGRGALSAAFLFSYAVTSIMAGYISNAMYLHFGGEKWIKEMIFTLLLLPSVCFGIGSILNAVASFCGVLAAVPSETMVAVFAIWGFISLPLGVIGAIVAQIWSGAPNDPCNVNKIPRAIPPQKWYQTPSMISLLGGLLPFGSIFIELSFLFASFWKYKVYYSYDILLLFFLVLILVTMCISILGTYILLNDENYHWQWTAFMSPASVSLYIYLYSIYYFHTETRMSGLFQTSYYFGSTLIFSLAIGLLCGAIGFLASSLFVRRIYRNVKGD